MIYINFMVVNHRSLWNTTQKRYDFLDREIEFDGAVYFKRTITKSRIEYGK